MRLIINGKVAAKVLNCMNGKLLAMVNACFFENNGDPVDFGICENNVYENLDVVVETGAAQGIKIQKIVHDWFIEQQNMFENAKSLA
jgi:hypothetical protein